MARNGRRMLIGIGPSRSWFAAALPLAAALTLPAAPGALAQGFTIEDGETETTTQVLDGANDVGLIEQGGQLNTVGVDAIRNPSTGTTVTITNQGAISTTGDFAEGIESQGENAVITNSGTIETAGGQADGISSQGADAAITNSGTIGTMGSGAEGILSTGDNAAITTSGMIKTAGNNAGAVESEGENAVITNSGAIDTEGLTAYGIFSTGANAVITNSWTIETEGNFADGMRSEGDTAIVTNSGTIGPMGEDADGISSIGGNAVITNSGTIKTARDDVFAIVSSGDDTVITTSGTIGTMGEGAAGISFAGANAVITNSGTIGTEEFDADGIISSVAANNAMITNSGTIETAGNGAQGIASQGGNAVITNSGTIESEGNSAFGIFSTVAANNAVITNSGLIETAGASADGIASQGENVVITNSGTIETAGNSADGIFSNGDNAAITNSGTIETVGGSAEGIISDGDNAAVTNSGTIETAEDFADGIRSLGENAVITNSGTIGTMSGDADGVFSTGDNAAIANSGVIETAGEDANGIFSIGMDAAITNSGTIRVSGAGSAAVILDPFSNLDSTLTNTGSLIATGDADFAILGGNGDQAVVLGPGSRVIGRIDLAGGDDSVTVIGAAGPSARITVENTETIALTGQTNGAFLLGDTVVTIDPTGQSFLGAAVSGLTGSAHGAINRRAPHATDGAAGSGRARAPLQLASLESDTRPRASAGLQTAQRRETVSADGPAAWGEVFGASGNRGDDGQTLAYDHDYIGAMGGYETSLDTFQLGVAAGFALGSIDTQESSIDTDVESYFVGLYGERDFGTLRLSGSLIGGYEEYESDRLVIDNLNGFETARSDVDNFFVSPSVTLGAGLPVAEGLELRPSGTATYTAAFFDSYSEEGTTASNLSVDSRTVQVLNTRLQLAVAMLPAGAEIELRGGLEGRFSDQDDVDGSLAGANFSFATTEDDSVYGGYVGMNVQVFAADRLAISGDVEYRSAGGDEDQISGALRATYRF